MDAYTPGDQEDLSAVERRLADWQPGTAGLDADAMLFAAGMVTGRAGRRPVALPTLCGLLGIVALGLGIWAATERADRQAIAIRLCEKGPVANPYLLARPITPEHSYEPSPNDYLSTRRLMEQDPNRWLALVQPEILQTGGSLSEREILTPRQRDRMFEQ